MSCIYWLALFCCDGATLRPEISIFVLLKLLPFIATRSVSFLPMMLTIHHLHRASQGSQILQPALFVFGSKSSVKLVFHHPFHCVLGSVNQSSPSLLRNEFIKKGQSVLIFQRVNFLHPIIYVQSRHGNIRVENLARRVPQTLSWNKLSRHVFPFLCESNLKFSFMLNQTFLFLLRKCD